LYIWLRRWTYDYGLNHTGESFTHICLCRQAIWYQRKLRRREVNRRTVRHTGPVAMVLRFRTVSGLRFIQSEVTAAYEPNGLAKTLLHIRFYFIILLHVSSIT